MPLTDTACKNAKPSDKARKMSDGNGLYLHVMPNGTRYWRMKYRFNGKEKLLSFGIYPEVTLAEARNKRTAARKLLADGIDPSQDKKEQKLLSTADASNTFEHIAREWHQLQSGKWTPAYTHHVLNRLQSDMFPLIGSLPISQITPMQMLDAIKSVENRGALEIAKRLKQTCSQIFRYAIITGRAERNPTADLQGALKPAKQGHYAALEFKELPPFLQALERNDARLYAHTRYALKLMVLTFVRTGELIAMRWDEINWDENQWEIPAERMKMRRPHVVPLSTQARTILEELRQLAPSQDFVPNFQPLTRGFGGHRGAIRAHEAGVTQ